MTKDNRTLAAYAAIEPCIVLGCKHEYGHEGQHDLEPSPITPLPGHTSPETAYLIADYPYGRLLRCKRRVWLESDAKRGFRFAAQTENPKNGRWNAPHKSTYVDVSACLYLDDKGHVQWARVGAYTDADQALAFARDFGAHCEGRERLQLFAAQKARLSEALASGKATFTINGVPQARSEADKARDIQEAAAWTQVSALLA